MELDQFREHLKNVSNILTFTKGIFNNISPFPQDANSSCIIPQRPMSQSLSIFSPLRTEYPNNLHFAQTIYCSHIFGTCLIAQSYKTH